jgi:hypothetical protein
MLHNLKFIFKFKGLKQINLGNMLLIPLGQVPKGPLAKSAVINFDLQELRDLFNLEGPF